MSYRLECWRYGFIGPDPQPHRVVQALIRYRGGHDMTDDTTQSLLRELVDWCRENTSPRDPNTPHDLLCRAVLHLAQRYPSEEGKPWASLR